jgi:hypothetical protein
MIMPTGALDLWSTLILGVFGSFWLAIIGIGVVIFIIMGVLGRVSIYTTTWYIIFYVLAFALGYGYVTLNILISLSVLVGFYFAMRNYLG